MVFSLSTNEGLKRLRFALAAPEPPDVHLTVRVRAFQAYAATLGPSGRGNSTRSVWLRPRRRSGTLVRGGTQMYAPLDDYTAAVARLGELYEKGSVRVKVAAGGSVELVVDHTAGDAPPRGDGLYKDIHHVLNAIGANISVDQFIQARSTFSPEFDGVEEGAVSRAKYEATAAAFRSARLTPGIGQRVGRRGKTWSASILLALGKRSGRLRKLMGWYAYRRVLGPDGRRRAWCMLGARIADTAWIGPRVWIRSPSRVSIGAGSKIAGRTMIESYGEVTIGRNVLLNDADLFTAQHFVDDPTFKAERSFIWIGDQAWLPHKIIILPGVRIGNYAVIGTGSVVSRDVPDYGVAVGNPAQVVKERAHIEYDHVPSLRQDRRSRSEWMERSSGS
jgi:acetyltransferase-like isoleucine patch superfamily enzyme